MYKEKECTKSPASIVINQVGYTDVMQNNHTGNQCNEKLAVKVQSKKEAVSRDDILKSVYATATTVCEGAEIWLTR